MGRLEIVYDDKLLFDANVTQLKFGQDTDSIELAARYVTTPASEGPTTPHEPDDAALPAELGDAMPGWEESGDSHD